jgi:tetratricopeptide (TPR) repeat protein
MLMDEPPDETWFNKGLALQNLEKYKQALECYDQYINFDEKNQNDASVLINKSAMLLELGENDDAIICYDRAIKLDSSLKTHMERPKPKMKLGKRVLRHAGIGIGIWGMFHVILAITRSVV